MKKRRKPKLNAEWWETTTDAFAMVNYLEDAGCYLEFEAFFMNCFDRIKHEFHSQTIVDTVYTFGVEVDELTDAAIEEIQRMTERLESLDQQSEKWNSLSREIKYSRAVLAREYHDFGEANRFLSEYLIEIADDANAEARTQADFLRGEYCFPFVPADDD